MAEMSAYPANVQGDPELALSTSPPPPAYGASALPVEAGPESPPPSYDEANKDAPPSYQSIFGQMQDAKRKSSGPLDYIKSLISLLLNTICVTIFMLVVLAIPIAVIVVGAIHMYDCPAEHKIPIYLVVMGSVYILKNLVDLRARCQKQGQTEEEQQQNPPTARDSFSRLLGCFLLAFFIAGNVWVYGIYKPNTEDSLSPDYCDPTLYYLAFWVTTGIYIICGLVCCCVCCTAMGAAATSSSPDQ